MDPDGLFLRYFGTLDIADVNLEVQTAGIERILVDFGLERDRGKRFALWILLYLLAAAPDLEVAFKDEADREAARNFMDQFAAVCEG